MDFSTIKVISKKVRGNNLDFSTSEITSKKVRVYDVGFSISEITSKRYVEMTRKFVEILSSTYRRNIDVKSTSIRRGVPVGNLGNGRVNLKFNNSVLVRKNFSSFYSNFILKLYIVYKLNTGPCNPANKFTLKNCLFGTVKLVRNTIKSNCL